MRIELCHRLACVVLAVVVAGLGGCAREPVADARTYGSLKDDLPAVRPARRVAGYLAVAPKPEPPSAPVTTAAIVEQRPAPPPAAAVPVPVPVPVPPLAAGAEPPLPPVEDAAGVARMLAEGLALFEKGEVVQARRRFVAAINGPDPSVVLALARTYDTYYLSRLPASDGPPDLQRALMLYERALARGALDAAPDLERTRGILKIPR